MWLDIWVRVVVGSLFKGVGENSFVFKECCIFGFCFNVWLDLGGFVDWDLNVFVWYVFVV